MKIGSKIALFYTLLSVLTTIIIIAVFYLFSTQFINKLYASYLREKAYLTAQKHWEKDEIDEQSYQIIQRKYDELLPEAHEILLNIDSLSEVRDTLNKYLTQHQQALLIAGEDSIPFSFKYKDQLGAALYYPDNEGNFIVLVMSECVRCRNQRTPLASLHLSGFIQFHPDLFSRENLFRPYSYPPAAYTEGAEEDTSQQSEPPVKDDRKQR